MLRAFLVLLADYSISSSPGARRCACEVNGFVARSSIVMSSFSVSNRCACSARWCISGVRMADEAEPELSLQPTCQSSAYRSHRPTECPYYVGLIVRMFAAVANLPVVNIAPRREPMRGCSDPCPTIRHGYGACLGTPVNSSPPDLFDNCFAMWALDHSLRGMVSPLASRAHVQSERCLWTPDPDRSTRPSAAGRHRPWTGSAAPRYSTPPARARRGQHASGRQKAEAINPCRRLLLADSNTERHPAVRKSDSSASCFTFHSATVYGFGTKAKRRVVDRDASIISSLTLACRASARTRSACRRNSGRALVCGEM